MAVVGQLHISFVCTGNICRSPMAEKIVESHLHRAGLADKVRVSSAGTTGWHIGADADPRTNAVLQASGHRTGHQAAEFGTEHSDADLVVALDRTHDRDLAALGIPKERRRLLRSFDPNADDSDVADPYYGSSTDFDRVHDQIEAAVPGLLDWVRSALASRDELDSSRRSTGLRRLAFLLRPGWLILAVIVVAFAYLCFTVLAPWQLGKNSDTSERNELIAESMQADPVPITDVLDRTDDKPNQWRQVTAEGSYVPDSTALVRLRHLDGAPAYAVLAAFRLTDGKTLLVDRGLVAAVEGSQPPQLPEPPAGPQLLEARIRASEGIHQDRLPTVQDGYRQVYSIDTEQETEVLDLPLTPIPTGDRGGYLQLGENQPGTLTPTPLPQLDAGPYLSYGLQWLAFGIMAPLGLGYFAYAEIRERRRSRTQAPHWTNRPIPTEPEPAAAASSTEDRLADRYGRARK